MGTQGRETMLRFRFKIYCSLLAVFVLGDGAFGNGNVSVTVLPTAIKTPPNHWEKLSKDGSVVMGSGIWSGDTGFIPSTTGNNLESLSRDGSTIVGTVGSTSGWHAATYDHSLSPQFLPMPSNVNTSTAYAVSLDGSVIAGWWAPQSVDGSHVKNSGFAWSMTGGFIDMGLAPNGYVGEPTAISDDGHTILTVTPSAAYLWTADGGYEDIGSFPNAPGGEILAWSMSGDGNSVVGTVFGAPRLPYATAFLWTRDGGFSGLGDSYGKISTQAYAVSADGRIVVGSTGYSSNQRAMVWDAKNGVRDLTTLLIDNGFDLGGTILDYATGISDDGQTILVDNLLIHLSMPIDLMTIPEPTLLGFAAACMLFVGRPQRRTLMDTL